MMRIKLMALAAAAVLALPISASAWGRKGCNSGCSSSGGHLGGGFGGSGKWAGLFEKLQEEIAELQAAAGDVDGVRETARTLDDPFRSAGRRALGVAQARAGDVAGALVTAHSITVEHHRNAVLAAVAVGI